jgi:hypothetical protein
LTLLRVTYYIFFSDKGILRVENFVVESLVLSEKIVLPVVVGGSVFYSLSF